jgi:hypothetical protein
MRPQYGADDVSPWHLGALPIMDRQRHALALAHRVLADAERRQAPTRPVGTARQRVATRQRAARSSIERRLDPAARTRLARRTATWEVLAGELASLGERVGAPTDADDMLRSAFAATSAGPPSRPIRTEGDRKLSQRGAPLRFIVDLGEERSAADGARHLSRSLGVRLGTGPDDWPSVQPLLRRPRRHRYFVLTLPLARSRGADRRFRLAAAIKDRTGAVSVQPDEPITLHGSTVDLLTGPPPLDSEWPLETMRVKQAWDLVPAGTGRRLGAGETIGHLDTGWFDHPEYDRERLDLERAHNAVTGATSSTAAAHSYEGGMNETHGVATGALMVSHVADPGTTAVTTVPAEPATPANTDLQITGVAPEANVLPVRCLDAVFVTMTNVGLVQGAEYLVEPEDPGSPAKVGVISMSLGGVPHFSLEEVLNVGVRDKGVIAVAAAGQVYGGPLPVAAPAAYPEVIAVAASTPDDAPAYWTFAGSEIDVAAPGESVWVADVRGEAQPDGTTLVNRFVGYGHGTSFSCALTAGVAALWRSFFADELASGAYDGVPVAHVFRQHLRDTARTPRDWDTSMFGAGIVDVEQLLATPLPAPADVLAPQPSTGWNPFLGASDGFQGSAEVFEGLLVLGGELANQLATLGTDVANAVVVTVAEMAAAGGAFVAAGTALGLAVFEQTAAAGRDLIESTWVEVERLADAAGDEMEKAAAAAAAALADAWQEAEAAAQAAADAAAEALEKGADDLVEVVEKAAEAAGESGKAVVDFFTGLLP